MTTDRVPAAFLSHSTADNETSERLASDLRANGVDVWYGEWELKPGDSLRRKIDEGINRASHFLVLLSPASLKSEWVQTELDAGMVKRIEGSCRLIPILHGISEEQMPATLRGIVWVRLEPYEAGLRKLVDICHNADLKPPVGSPPRWIQEKPLDRVGLSIHAQRLAALLNQKSKCGMGLDPLLTDSEVLSSLDLNEEEVAIAADELEDLGWVKLHLTLGMGKAGFTRISPTEFLFFSTDQYLQGWDTEDDARALAAIALNTRKDQVSLKDLDRVLSWGPRRINPAAAYLAEYGYVDASKTLGSYPYAYHAFAVIPRTRRFAATR